MITKRDAENMRVAAQAEVNMVISSDHSQFNRDDTSTIVPTRLLKSIDSMKRILQSFDVKTGKFDLTPFDMVVLEHLVDGCDKEIRDPNGVLWEDWEFYYDASGNRLRPTSFTYGPYSIKLPPETEEELETARNWKLLCEEQNRILGCRRKEIYEKGGDRLVFSEVNRVKNDPELYKVNVERYEMQLELKEKYEKVFNDLRNELKRKFEEHQARKVTSDISSLLIDEMDVFGPYYYKNYGPKKYMDLSNLEEVAMNLHPAEIDVNYAIFRYFDVQVDESKQAELRNRESNPNSEVDYQKWLELEKAYRISCMVVNTDDNDIKGCFDKNSDDQDCLRDAMWALEDALSGDTLTENEWCRLMRMWGVSLDPLRHYLEDNDKIHINYNLVPEELRTGKKAGVTPVSNNDFDFSNFEEFKDIKGDENNMQLYDDRNDDFYGFGNDNQPNWVEEKEAGRDPWGNNNSNNSSGSYNYDDWNVDGNSNNNSSSGTWFDDNNTQNDDGWGTSPSGWGGMSNKSRTKNESSLWDMTPEDYNNNKNNNRNTRRTNNNNRGRSNTNSGSNWWDDYYNSNNNSNNKNTNSSSGSIWGDLGFGNNNNSNVNWDEVDKLVEELRSNRDFVSYMSDNTYNTAWKDLLPLVYKRDTENLQVLSNIIKALRAKSVKDGSAKYVDPRVFTKLLAEISPQQNGANGAKFSDDYSAYQNDTTEYDMDDIDSGYRNNRRYRDNYDYGDSYSNRRRKEPEFGGGSRRRKDEFGDDTYDDWMKNPYQDYAQFDDQQDNGGIRDRQRESGGVR